MGWVADDVGLVGCAACVAEADGVALCVMAGADDGASPRAAVDVGGAATTLEAGADDDVGAGPETRAPLTWSACCSARALLHAARIAAVSAIIAPKRAR